MDLSTLLRSIFDTREEAPLDVLDERLLITAAQAGDAQATGRLAVAYGPALRAAVAGYVRSLPSFPQPADLDDVRSQALVGFLEAVRAFNPERHERLAATIASYVQHEVAEVSQSAAAFTIPPRTLSRFFGILRAAEGDVDEALRLAPHYKMREETFTAVLDSIRKTNSYESLVATAAEGGYTSSYAARTTWQDPALAAVSLSGGDIADVEDRILVETAFDAVDTLEKDVVGLAYGFTDYDPVADAEIGERLGMSRAKIQRTRTGALVKMRSALGVA